jgi:hypothetical protein
LKEAKVPNQCFCFLLTSVIISLLPVASLEAQRATQVVRYSITGVSQAQITSGPPGSAGTTTSSGGGFGSSSTAAPSSQTSSGSQTSSTVKPPAAMVPAARPPSTVPTTTTAVWQASYQISNNEDNKKLSISIDSPMPDGMELTANIGAPKEADASGPVDLETAAQDVVTGLGKGESGAMPIELSLTTPEGSTENAGNRKVTFTFISGS